MSGLSIFSCQFLILVSLMRPMTQFTCMVIVDSVKAER